jgi:uncharacterized membrane protein
MIEPILVIGIVVALTAWYVQHRWRRWLRVRRARENVLRSVAVQHANGLEVLARRYARGEIDRAEYLRKKGDIVGAEIPLMK